MNCSPDVGDRDNHSDIILFGGLPRGRRLASSPKRLAVTWAHSSSPNGVPRFTLRRMLSKSASVIGAFKWASQVRGRGTGLSLSQVSAACIRRAPRLSPDTCFLRDGPSGTICA
jgi:hypothetical protein